jgi:ketosteroid isomerase-like protein
MPQSTRGPAAREPAREPNDLERLLVDRQRAGDIDGMIALFAPDAIIDVGDGKIVKGHAEMRVLYEGFEAAGRKFQYGVQQPARINGDLALTSTRSVNGSVTTEVARRQPDGTWLWVIDVYSIA